MELTEGNYKARLADINHRILVITQELTSLNKEKQQIICLFRNARNFKAPKATRKPQAASLLPSESPATCVLCCTNVNDAGNFGDKFRVGDLTFHYLCAALSPYVKQREEDGELRLLHQDLVNVLKQSSRVTCGFCQASGASIHCHTCNMAYHLPCGLLSNCLFVANRTVSYCAAHRPHTQHNTDAGCTESCEVPHIQDAFSIPEFTPGATCESTHLKIEQPGAYPASTDDHYRPNQETFNCYDDNDSTPAQTITRSGLPNCEGDPAPAKPLIKREFIESAEQSRDIYDSPPATGNVLHPAENNVVEVKHEYGLAETKDESSVLMAQPEVSHHQLLKTEEERDNHNSSTASACTRDSSDSATYHDTAAISTAHPPTLGNTVTSSSLTKNTCDLIRQANVVSREKNTNCTVGKFPVNPCKLLYNCLVCNKDFAQLSKLKTHQRVHGSGKQYNICNTGAGDGRKNKGNLQDQRRTPKGKKPYKCNNRSCRSAFSQRDHLEKHALTHTGAKPFKCRHENCHSAFSHFGSLQYHERKHSGEKPFKCSHAGCNSAFIMRGNLQNHERTHTGEKPYKCGHEGCKSAFSQCGNLQIHERTHTGEKPYKCRREGCKSAFSQCGNLQIHERTHTGEKPYKCKREGCKAAFSRRGTLQYHERKHTGEKPYKCKREGCKAAFSRRGTLQYHERKHTGEKPYECTHEGCNSAFNQSGTLRRHERTHTGEKPYKCSHEGCHSAFSQRWILQSHERTHSGDKLYKCRHEGG